MCLSFPDTAAFPSALYCVFTRLVSFQEKAKVVLMLRLESVSAVLCGTDISSGLDLVQTGLMQAQLFSQDRTQSLVKTLFYTNNSFHQIGFFKYSNFNLGQMKKTKSCLFARGPHECSAP